METRRPRLVWLLVGLATACGSSDDRAGREPDRTDPRGSLLVTVSIPPEKYFVERVGGSAVQVGVLVGPGQSPATYDPTPRQMAELSDSRLYFRMGVPFEQAWLGRIRTAHPSLPVVDLRQGIPLLPLGDHGQGGSEVHDDRAGEDPHVWMSPRLVAIMTGTIRDALADALPSRRAEFAANAEVFAADLEALDRDIAEMFRGARTRTFMAFHPAWGYFARDYGLRQIPIESAGKEPGAQTLGRLIDLAVRDSIRVMVVQAQFSVAMARTVAHATGADILVLDPLAEDYLSNMRRTAELLSGALSR